MPYLTGCVQKQLSDTAALEAAVDEAVANCDGAARAAKRVLLLALNAYEVKLAALWDDVAQIRAGLDDGATRRAQDNLSGAGPKQLC